MDTDPGILCYQHCGTKVFCFQLPRQCAVCEKTLAPEDLHLPPFRVPCPFVRAAQHPCSIVIKPTTGDFLNDYLNSTDLHIGLTTSTGVVVEFDKCGLQRDRSAMWLQCVSVPGVTGSWTEHWDGTLENMISSGCWVADRYDECSFNCYTFVLTFLQTLQCGELSDAASSRTTFCKQFIVPKTAAAGKYISLYRKLQNSGCYVYPCSSINNIDLAVR